MTIGARTLALFALLTTPAMAAERVQLETATVEQLDAIEGVEPGLAQAIVSLRESRGGRLASVDELRVLPGIDARALDGLRRATEVRIELPVGAVRAYVSVDEVMSEFASEPTIGQVHEWANEYANTSPELVRRWLTQSKTFALLPDVGVQYRVRSGWDVEWLYAATDGSIDTPDEQLYDYLNDAQEDQDVYYTVAAAWDLNELIMSSERIRMISESQDIVKLRDNVLSEVTSVYFDRRRLQVEMLLSPKSDLRGQINDRLRLSELTANLDALTGGQFSAALQR